MCLEDIKLGRKTKTTEKFVSVSPTSTVLVDANPYCVGLIISAPLTNHITLSLKDTAVDAQGINLAPNVDPLELDIQSHGGIVMRKITAICAGGTEKIGVWITELVTDG